MAVPRNRDGAPTVGQDVSLSPLLSLPGAVAGIDADAQVAWHYGDPTAEQRALAAGRAFVDQSNLGVVTVTGPDRLTWLDSLTTQSVARLEPGESTELMVLSPQGRVEHVAGAIDDGATTWLITETAPGLARFLDRMRFMMQVEVVDVSEEWAVLGSPQGLSALIGVGTPSLPAQVIEWVDPWPRIGDGGTTYVAADSTAPAPWSWRLSIVPRERLGEIAAQAQAHGLNPAGTWAFEALRIAAHRPRMIEVDATTLPHELDWLRTAVNLHKGCYRGQETVAKVHNVGRPPRRLTMLHLDGSDADLPLAGAEVTLGGEAIGRVTSASRHYELGPIALAVLKRSVDPTATLTVAGESGPMSAAQEVIVNSDGVSADRPPAPGPTMRGLLMGDRCKADGGDM